MSARTITKLGLVLTYISKYLNRIKGQARGVKNPNVQGSKHGRANGLAGVIRLCLRTPSHLQLLKTLNY
jgi:hypothetical protein